MVPRPTPSEIPEIISDEFEGALDSIVGNAIFVPVHPNDRNPTNQAGYSKSDNEVQPDVISTRSITDFSGDPKTNGESPDTVKVYFAVGEIESKRLQGNEP